MIVISSVLTSENTDKRQTKSVEGGWLMEWERDQIGWFAVIRSDDFAGLLDLEIQYVHRGR